MADGYKDLSGMPRAYEDLAGLPDKLREALIAFDQEAEESLNAFVTELEQRKPPDILYHYTDDVGLKGILESGKLRLTDIHNLNDPSELTHGYSHAIRIVNSLLAGKTPLHQRFANNFERFHSDGGIRESQHCFVVCFSSNGNDLGQWRSYGDDGRGYALGFETASLEHAFARSSGSANGQSFWVTYDENRLFKLQHSVTSNLEKLISIAFDFEASGKVGEYLERLSQYLTVHCLRIGLLFKHEAYKNEGEYRFLELLSAEEGAGAAFNYRTRPYELVRYREFEWKREAPHALKQVVIGPAANKEKAYIFLGACERAFLSGHPPLGRVISATPYRA